MIRGITASVELRDRSARDSFGNDVEAYLPQNAVDNVLVQPGAAAELDATRPDGVRVSLTLHFPKGWTGDLRGARVSLPAPWDGGNPYRVVGDPRPYMDANTPGAWHMAVEVERAHG